ncbi:MULTISPECIES: hypothetical protein [Lysinibacillus]|uniref:hypothetical protein n=1 Tax=Lysinibacillus TaxID=400634 RepID=UPI00055D2D79|nr:hypothetical protein [Lysinibacillus sphaericus]
MDYVKIVSSMEAVNSSFGGVINTFLAQFLNGRIGSGKTKLINAYISNIEFVDANWQIDHLPQCSNESEI